MRWRSAFWISFRRTVPHEPVIKCQYIRKTVQLVARRPTRLERHKCDGLLEDERLSCRSGRQRRQGSNGLQGQFFGYLRGRPKHFHLGEFAVGRDLYMESSQTLLNALHCCSHFASNQLSPVVSVTLAVLECVGGGLFPFLWGWWGRRWHRSQVFLWRGRGRVGIRDGN